MVLRRFSYALTLVVATASGCATGSKSVGNADAFGSTSTMSASETTAAATLNSPRYKQLIEQFSTQKDPLVKAAEAANAPASPSFTDKLVTATKKTSESISDALTIQPKVIPADDPVKLTSKPPKLSHEVHFRAARLHENSGNTKEAMEHYAQALDLKPDDVRTLISVARLQDRDGNYHEAIQYYHRAIKVEPNNPIAHNDLGLCYARKGELDKSIRALEQAVRLEGTRKLYRNNLATVLIEARRIDEALAHLTSVHPAAVAHYNVGYLLNQAGHRDEAMFHVQHASQLDPTLVAASELIEQMGGARSTMRAPEAVAAQTRGPARAHVGDPRPPATTELSRVPPTEQEVAPDHRGADRSQATSEPLRYPVRTLSATIVEPLGDDAPSPGELPAMRPLRQPPRLMAPGDVP